MSIGLTATVLHYSWWVPH